MAAFATGLELRERRGEAARTFLRPLEPIQIERHVARYYSLLAARCSRLAA